MESRSVVNVVQQTLYNKITKTFDILNLWNSQQYLMKFHIRLSTSTVYSHDNLDYPAEHGLNGYTSHYSTDY